MSALKFCIERIKKVHKVLLLGRRKYTTSTAIGMYQAPDFWLICMFLALHHNKFNNPKSLLPENWLKAPD
jgi:hypothetical protein